MNNFKRVHIFVQGCEIGTRVISRKGMQNANDSVAKNGAGGISGIRMQRVIIHIYNNILTEPQIV